MSYYTKAALADAYLYIHPNSIPSREESAHIHRERSCEQTNESKRKFLLSEEAEIFLLYRHTNHKAKILGSLSPVSSARRVVKKKKKKKETDA